MKKLIAFILILSSLFLTACAGTAPEDSDGKLKIVTTVFPAYDFARAIAGDRAEVTLLIPPGAEIHSFEPTAKDVVSIENCTLLVCNGGESEAWLTRVLDGVEKDVDTVVMMECVTPLEEELKEGMEGEKSDEKEFDEHVWTSPVNAALICKQICAELSRLDKENEAYYAENCASYCQELSELDAAFREVAANARGNTLIFADRFPVRYFVEEYGLDYYAAFSGCADDAEASAKTVRFLIEKVKDNAVPTVLYIEFSNEKMADTVCEDTGCGKVLFHSCHNVSADDMKNGVSYIQLMWNNVDSVREALG